MSAPKNNTAAALTATDLIMIEKWVRLADSIGFPKSYAQIYGLCFISKQAVSAQDCVDKLQISRSSAGQGLKLLKELGAIKSEFSLGSRVERYSIEPDLGVLIKSIVDGKIAPAFESFFNDIESSANQLSTQDEGAFIINRLKKLERWHSKFDTARQWLAQ